MKILEKHKSNVGLDAFKSHQEVVKSNDDTKKSLEEIIVPEKKSENSLFGKKIIEGKSDSTSGIFSKELKSPLIPEIKVFGQKLDSYKNLGDTIVDKKNFGGNLKGLSGLMIGMCSKRVESRLFKKVDLLGTGLVTTNLED